MEKLRTECADIAQKLCAVGLRPTRQRLLLGRLLFSQGCRHITAEELHTQAKESHIDVSLATVYNTLNQFTRAKLLREVSIEGQRSYFDTNVSAHHHFLCEETGKLTDIAAEDVSLEYLPVPPAGTRVSSVDVVIRLKPATV